MYWPVPSTLELPYLSEVTCRLLNDAPITSEISSTVVTSIATAPAPSGVAVTVALARKGCARSTRSVSARRSSVHTPPSLSCRKLCTTRDSVVLCCIRTLLTRCRTVPRLPSDGGSCGWIVIVVMRWPSHVRTACGEAPIAVVSCARSAGAIASNARHAARPRARDIGPRYSEAPSVFECVCASEFG